MNFKRILTLSCLLIAAYSFAYAGQPTTSDAAPDNTEDYCDHAEFEALFNVEAQISSRKLRTLSVLPIVMVTQVRRVSTVRASQVISISV